MEIIITSTSPNLMMAGKVIGALLIVFDATARLDRVYFACHLDRSERSRFVLAAKY